jgi:hypothetical protein
VRGVRRAEAVLRLGRVETASVLPEVCERCGFRGGTVSPRDAVVALRSFPRRYRERVETIRRSGGGDQLMGCRLLPSRWSVVEYLGHVRDAFHVVADRLDRVLVSDHPALGALPAETPSPDRQAPPEALLADLATAADRLARLAADVRGEDWWRSGVLRDTPVTALELLRAAVHEGAHHLRDIDDVLAETRVVAPGAATENAPPSR